MIIFISAFSQFVQHFLEAFNSHVKIRAIIIFSENQILCKRLFERHKDNKYRIFLRFRHSLCFEKQNILFSNFIIFHNFMINYFLEIDQKLKKNSSNLIKFILKESNSFSFP
jgi:hypothetical protein